MRGYMRATSKTCPLCWLIALMLHQNEVVVAQLKVTAQSAELDAAVTERVQRALSYAYPVQIRYVDEIDWGNSWKQEYFSVSDAPPG